MSNYEPILYMTFPQIAEMESKAAIAERERIIKLLEQTESPSHLWGGIAWAITLIKGEK